MAGQPKQAALPLAVILFFNGKFSYIFFLIEFILFIYKGVRYEYPEQVQFQLRLCVDNCLCRLTSVNFSVDLCLGNRIYRFVLTTRNSQSFDRNQRSPCGTGNSHYYIDHYDCDSSGFACVLPLPPNVRYCSRQGSAAAAFVVIASLIFAATVTLLQIRFDGGIGPQHHRLSVQLFLHPVRNLCDCWVFKIRRIDPNRRRGAKYSRIHPLVLVRHQILIKKVRCPRLIAHASKCSSIRSTRSAFFPFVSSLSIVSIATRTGRDKVNNGRYVEITSKSQ